MTSHAAVVARGMGKCCVAGASEVKVDEENEVMRVDSREYHTGDIISIDGSTGEIFEGEVKKINPTLSGNFEIFMKWVDEIKRLKIKANADTPQDATQAIEFGADGIGLCRTEHMFFKENRIIAVREMIIAKNIIDRKKALDKIIPFQRDDFYKMFKALNGHSFTIRLLDPPLHEFIPHNEEDIKKLAEELNIDKKVIHDTIIELAEVNPMLGHRGLRLAVTYPEIYRMQVRAIMEAAIKCKRRNFCSSRNYDSTFYRQR